MSKDYKQTLTQIVFEEHQTFHALTEPIRSHGCLISMFQMSETLANSVKEFECKYNSAFFGFVNSKELSLEDRHWLFTNMILAGRVKASNANIAALLSTGSHKNLLFVLENVMSDGDILRDINLYNFDKTTPSQWMVICKTRHPKFSEFIRIMCVKVRYRVMNTQDVDVKMNFDLEKVLPVVKQFYFGEPCWKSSMNQVLGRVTDISPPFPDDGETILRYWISRIPQEQLQFVE